MKLSTLNIASALWLMAAVPAVSQAVTLSPSALIAMKKASTAAEARMVSAFLTVDPTVFNRDDITAVGGSVIMVAGNIATARIPISAIKQIREIPGIEYIQISSSVTQQLDRAIPEVGADAVKSGVGLSQGYTGQGVVVGIVDAGFDYNHAAFRDKDGNLRIKRVWEQTTLPDETFHSPQRFGYGVELTTPEEIIAAEGDIRNNTHGTHVAGIAAASDAAFDGVFQGAAPDADIVLVSMDSQSNDNVAIAEGVAYIFDYAESVGKPCVVNLSLGTHAGPHDGTSSFDRLIDEMQGPGRLIVGSAGNDRASKFHVTHTFTSEEDAPLRTFVNYLKSVNKMNVGGDIEVWGSADQDFEVALTTVNTHTGEVSDRVVIYPAEEDATTVSLGRNVSGTFTVAVEKANPLNLKPHIVMTSEVTAFRTNYAVAIEVTPKTAGQVDIWGDNVYLGLSGKDVEGYSDANGSTIAELGGTSKRILTVGAYTTRKDYTLYGETGTNTLDETVGAISSFSNYGPTADGRMKPQVAAPGCFIISAVSVNAVSASTLSHSYEKDGRWMSYGYMQGTSMSSPLVAGVTATWLQAYPELTPEELADVVQKTSRADEFTGDLTQGSNDWGWGKLDAMAGLKECLKLADANGIETLTSSKAQINLNGENLNIIFDRAAPVATISVYNILGKNVMTQTVSSVTAGLEANISLSSLTQGVYIVSVATKESISTIKITR